MLRPKAAREEFVEKILRIVHVHLNLFEDDLPLFSDVVGIEERPEDEIGHDVEGDGKMFVQHLHVEADLLLGGEGVQHAADGIHLAGDGFGGAALGTLEDHVLHEVGKAVFVRSFAAGAVADPNSNGNRADVRHGLRNGDEAVGKDLLPDMPGIGDHF